MAMMNGERVGIMNTMVLIIFFVDLIVLVFMAPSQNELVLIRILEDEAMAMILSHDKFMMAVAKSQFMALTKDEIMAAHPASVTNNTGFHLQNLRLSRDKM